jgi:hypothetical protein
MEKTGVRSAYPVKRPAKYGEFFLSGKWFDKEYAKKYNSVC